MDYSGAEYSAAVEMCNETATRRQRRTEQETERTQRRRTLQDQLRRKR